MRRRLNDSRALAKVRERAEDCMAGGGPPCTPYVAFPSISYVPKIHLLPRPRRNPLYHYGVSGPLKRPRTQDFRTLPAVRGHMSNVGGNRQDALQDGQMGSAPAWGREGPWRWERVRVL